jgi:hypothetical protein
VRGAVRPQDWRQEVGNPAFLPKPVPNPYEDSLCQETNYSLERFFVVFPPFGSWRDQHPVSCADLISVHGCQRCVAAPHTYGGSIITAVTIAEPHCGEPLRPRKDVVPSYRPTQTPGCTFVCASEAQVRGRGSPRSPSGTFALWTGAEAGVQSNAQGQGTCLCAHERSPTQEVPPCRARWSG